MKFKKEKKVLLKLPPMKGWNVISKKGELSLWYIGPFEVLKKIGSTEYRLAVTTSIFRVHPVFHVSMLKKYHRDGGYVMCWDSKLLIRNYPMSRN